MSDRQWASRERAAEHVGVHPNTIDNWRAQGLITGYKIGRTVRFDLTEIDQIIITSQGVAQ